MVDKEQTRGVQQRPENILGIFGNDLYATVMTERFGFGQFRTRTKGWWLCREGGHSDERGKQRQWGLTKSHEDKGFFWSRRKREERGPIVLREGQQGQEV